MKTDDVVLCPDGAGSYRAGEICGPYLYEPNGPLPHRRPVRWLDQTFSRDDMSESFKNSTGSAGTVSNVSAYAEEIEKLLRVPSKQTSTPGDETVEDAVGFMMEKHLEDSLVHNWSQTELGKDFDIYEDEGGIVGQQYVTDTGPLDILAISKDKKRLLVIELKKGRASDVVVGQTLRYMGYVMEELAEDGQTVEGLVIAAEDDQRIRRAIAPVPNLRFYRYQISFKLQP